MDSIYEELELSLSQPGERKITETLKNYPLVLLWSFCWTGGHTKYILSEFEFGNQFRADFVVLLSYSGCWEVYFIELENTDDIVITKAGKPSSRLNSAMSQVNDWNYFIDKNKRLVQEDLSRACQKSDILKMFDPKFEPHNWSGDYLKDSDTYVKFYYRIVIGRRDKITKESRVKMNQYSHTGLAEICTFDRFLDVAKNFDDYNFKLREGVCLTERYGV